MKLNFSGSLDDSKNASDSNDSTDFSKMSYSRKRQLNEMTGLDVVKKFHEKEVELVGAKTTITKLESRINNLDHSRKKIKIDYNFEIESLKRQHAMDKELIDDLKHKIKQMQTKKQEIKDERFNTASTVGAAYRDLQNKHMKLQTVFNQIKNDHQTELFKLQEKLFQYEKESEENKTKVYISEKRNLELESQLMLTKGKAEECAKYKTMIEKLSLQLDNAKARITNLELSRDL